MQRYKPKKFEREELGKELWGLRKDVVIVGGHYGGIRMRLSSSSRKLTT